VTLSSEPIDAAGEAEDDGHDDTESDTDTEQGEERQAKAPWHFKFIVVGSVVYLGWRLYQGISWLAHHL
jgi:hypothetical protein